MSQSLRHSELFAGQDWTVIYKAFNDVNLNSYDWDTIRSSMIDYIQRTYPEDFNDWIESSEFVAIIDLFAYLGQSLAFRMDISARENFMDLARARESVLRLSRFLSYSPKRNYAANGLVKISEIRATQDIIDSNGNNLNNILIKWNDPNNPNWMEQFTLILNACLISTNPFGQPLKSTMVNGVNTQLYQFNNTVFTAGNIPFNSTVSNTNMSFDIVNVDFDDKKGFYERPPNPQNAIHIIYRNDGNGNSSKDTGFFFMFKQGTLNRSDFSVSSPMENRVIDISANNINETDIWVQTVTDQGLVSDDWKRVGFVPTDDISKIVIDSDNVTYSSVPANVQNIFQVITRNNDQVSIRFGDGRFGKIPTGNIRIWYRQSIGESFSIRPENIRNTQVNIPYIGSNKKQNTLSISFSLQETVMNSIPAETVEEIRRRTGSVYATQGRMVSGDDYNALPITNNIALKTKAINRTYSGHSRYIDLNDPTGTYQNTNVFSDDGILYKEEYNYYQEIPFNINRTNQEMITLNINPAISRVETRDFIYDQWLTNANKIPEYNFVFDNDGFYWQKSSNEIYSSTGRFGKGSVPPNNDTWFDTHAAPLGFNAPSNSPERYIFQGSMVKFKNTGWATVNRILGFGDSIDPVSGEGDVRLNESINTYNEVGQVLPAFRKSLNFNETTELDNRFDARRTFGMGFDHSTQEWYFINGDDMSLDGEYNYSTKGTNNDTSWIIKCEYSSLNWRIASRGIRYIFESSKDVKFYFTKGSSSVDPQTGKLGIDHIKILRNNNTSPVTENAIDWSPCYEYKSGDTVRIKKNNNPNEDINNYNYYICVRDHVSGLSFKQFEVFIDNTDVENPFAVVKTIWEDRNSSLENDHIWDIKDVYFYDDGYQEPRRVHVSFHDSDFDGQPDNPESFYEIVRRQSLVFHKRYTDIYGYQNYETIDDMKYFNKNDNMSVLEPNEVVYIYDNNILDGEFYICNLTSKGIPNISLRRDISPLSDQTEYTVNIGRNDINYNWKHYAPLNNRIDPSVSNIIDTFVLTKEYNENVLTWVRNGAIENMIPKPPSELQLRMAYSDLEKFKMFSDEIIWRPVKYKFLFGNGAKDELKAKFKIVKLEGTSISDGEIKTRVIQAIQRFFDVNSWDFGETFYYTELSSFIHNQLLNAIASVVIVPIKESQSFGDLFEVRCNPDEIFYSTASVNSIEIIPSNTQTSLRIK